MKAGSADVFGQGTADLVDASLELSDVSSVDVSEYGPKESRERTDGSDEIHDLHCSFVHPITRVEAKRGATRHRRGTGRRSVSLPNPVDRAPAAARPTAVPGDA